MDCALTDVKPVKDDVAKWSDRHQGPVVQSTRPEQIPDIIRDSPRVILAADRHGAVVSRPADAQQHLAPAGLAVLHLLCKAVAGAVDQAAGSGRLLGRAGGPAFGAEVQSGIAGGTDG